eukprot:scaffold117190_cov15-Tisochrysis_lutea.AAC.1
MPSAISRSKRPARLRAGSSESGRFDACACPQRTGRLNKMRNFFTCLPLVHAFKGHSAIRAHSQRSVTVTSSRHWVSKAKDEVHGQGWSVRRWVGKAK